MKVLRIPRPVAFFLALFFILLFVTQAGVEESNEMVVGSANLTHAGRKGDDHDCEEKRSNNSDKCTSREREGEQNGESDSDESVFENEDYIYTQSLTNP